MEKKGIGITGKFITFIFIILLVILSAISVRFIIATNRAMEKQAAEFYTLMESEQQRRQEALEQRLVAKGELLGNTLAQTAGSLLLNYNFEAVKLIARNAEEDRDIELVEFTDADGRLITEEKDVTSDEVNKIEMDVTQQGVLLGKLRLYLSTQALNEEYAQIAQKMAEQKDQSIAGQQVAAKKLATEFIVLSCVGLLLVGLVISLLFAKMIVAPLRRDMEMAEAIGDKGDLSTRLSIHSSDEIGQLGMALDSMADGLQRKVELAEIIASGNLMVDVDLASEKDALGKALERMIKSLNGLVSEVNNAAEEIAAGASQITNSSQSLSHGTTEQATSLEEISSSMTEMGSQTKHNAENANQANQLSSEVKLEAEKGNQLMQEMVSAMTEINDGSKNISKIIKVIDEIAFQTNLLALNAAVEAARAGKHGKGFAVVAEEVRNLAARSAKAAKETGQLIEGSVAKVSVGTETANQTAEALGHIVNGIIKVTDLIEGIANASNEQAQGISQVNEGLGHIDMVAQQNTASAEESAAAAEELSSQASQLRATLSKFTLNEKMQNVQSVIREREQPRLSTSQKEKGKDEKNGLEENRQAALEISLDDKEYGKY